MPKKRRGAARGRGPVGDQRLRNTEIMLWDPHAMKNLCNKPTFPFWEPIKKATPKKKKHNKIA